MSELAEYLPGDLQDEAGNPETDLEAEHKLIGLLLWKPELAGSIRDLVSPDLFFDRALGRIYSGLLALDGFEPDTQQIAGWIGMADIAGRTGAQAIGFLRATGAGLLDSDAAELADRIFEVGERRLTAQGQVNIAEPFKSKMGLIMWADRNTAVTDHYDFLIEDLIPEKELSIIMGATQAGKSFFGFDMAMSIARGIPFWGRQILKAQPVIWGAWEGGRGARDRMLAYERHNELQGSAYPFAALTRPVDLWSRDTNVVELIREGKGIISTEFGGVQPAAFFVDTHNAATPGASEIDSEAVSKIRDRYRYIIRELGCALVIIGHTNALGKHRGNELLVNNVDTVLTVKLKTVTKNRAAEQLRDDDRRDIREVRIEKQREGQTGHLTDFVLPAVETGIKNKFGKIRTSCVVVKPNWTAQAEAEANAAPAKKQDTKAGFKLTDQEDHFFTVLWKALQERGASAPPAFGLPPATKVVHRADVKKLYSATFIPKDGSAPESENTIGSRWTRATGKLRRFNVIGYQDNLFWWTGKAILGKPETYRQQTLPFNNEPPPTDEFPEDFADE